MRWLCLSAPREVGQVSSSPSAAVVLLCAPTAAAQTGSRFDAQPHSHCMPDLQAVPAAGGKLTVFLKDHNRKVTACEIGRRTLPPGWTLLLPAGRDLERLLHELGGRSGPVWS